MLKSVFILIFLFKTSRSHFQILLLQENNKYGISLLIAKQESKREKKINIIIVIIMVHYHIKQLEESQFIIHPSQGPPKLPHARTQSQLQHDCSHVWHINS